MNSGNGTLVLLRHGQSSANAEGIFTGLLDVSLTPKGEAEAHAAAALISAARIIPDRVFTSPMLRTRQTTKIVATELGIAGRACEPDRRLNERNYGALTGQTKSAIRAEFGDEAFWQWRRSVDHAPPPMDDELHDLLAATELFRTLPPSALTRTESLRDVIERIVPFLDQKVIPLLRQAETVLVIAHGNSLRAVCAVLDSLDDSELEILNIPTGQPLVYRFGDGLVPLIRGGKYLDETTARAAAIALTNEGGT